MERQCIEISVRELVEFLMRSGSIDNRFGGFDRANEGARIHRKLQKESDEQYKSEVTLAIENDYRGFAFSIRGRADGVIDEGSLAIIDEIKTTTQDISEMNEDDWPVHWAQAKCYGYIYGIQHHLEMMVIQLTYYQVETKTIRRFQKTFSMMALKDFYFDLLDHYIKWATLKEEWIVKRNRTIEGLSFPYKFYRRGQREMAVAVYNSIKTGGHLFCQAPTGIGKTLSTLFPSVKAMGENLIDKIFYLTAKTITGQAAISTFALMRQNGLCIKTVMLTAKDKICFLEERNCNPEACPYADGYFDKINAILYATLQSESDFSKERIEKIAKEHEICPFELGLDLSLWCDAIVCDYNYLFDPMVALKRFFSEGKKPYAFLIDEAHNLVDRARNMYSASLKKSAFLTLKRHLPKKNKALSESVKKINQFLLELRKKNDDTHRQLSTEPLSELNELLGYFIYACETFLKKNPEDSASELILELYFNVRNYLKIAEFYDDHYTTSITCFRSEVIVKQLCLDPGKHIKNGIDFGRTAVFFSATLTPLDYFIAVLGGDKNTPRYQLPSPFNPGNLGILMEETISTRYVDREWSYEPIAELIGAFINGKIGHYIVYFPSYAYLNAVYTLFAEKQPQIRTLVQTGDMDEKEREDFLNAFKLGHGDETLVGFCVLGGIYSEGIDLKGDRLIGTVIVGVGLPQIGVERNIIRDYFNEKSGSGFAFAYQYPGMNKVLQAIGRVIRDDNDRGMALLIDSRFGNKTYRSLFPPHLAHYVKVKNSEDVNREVIEFWKEREKEEERWKKKRIL
ncbi:MAG: helicase C-terminal domain-containing protein [Eubacterium sp.]